MATRLLQVTALLVTAFVPATAPAASIVFDPQGTTQVAGWKVVAPATSEGRRGYWDRHSYDSAFNAPPGACTTAALVGGGTCDWNAPGGVTPLVMPGHGDPARPLEYFGLLSAVEPSADAPRNMFFTGGLAFDWTLMFQLTAWDTDVEFGWYRAGLPDDRTPVLVRGAAPSPTRGSTTIPPDTAFGFYYRSTRFPSGDVLFFTESRFNRTGGYLEYFEAWRHDGSASRIEDELAFVPHAPDDQQFVVFRQGDRYWVGLEDQMGRATPYFCGELTDQPCADYDFNDLVIGWQDRTVPESASLALLSAGLFGLAWRCRRRRCTGAAASVRGRS